jgi:hypothetical protein
MLSPAYLSQKLARQIPTKDGTILRTIRDARDYMLALPNRRATRQQWQIAAELILDQANVPAVSRQIELALFYEAKLDIVAMEISARSSVVACRPAPAIRSQRLRASRRK